jgi:hypothetical protein
VDRAEKIRAGTSATAKDLARDADGALVPDGLAELNKSDLLKLAAARGVDGRSRMSKQQLITAVKKS